MRMTRALRPVAVAGLVVIAMACAGNPPSSPASGPTATPEIDVQPISTEVAATPIAARFPPGIYVREPNTRDPGARLVSADGKELAPGLKIPPGGFDLLSDVLIYPGGDDSLVIVTPDGGERMVKVEGLHAIARPSLSPGGDRAVVQASETPGVEFGSLHIYVIDLSDGTWTRLSQLSYEANEESPEWFPESNRIAYSSFSPERGVNLHVADLDSPGHELVFPEAGSIHVDVSRDGRFILDPSRMRVYETARGDLVTDISFEVRAALAAAGYAEDTRFPGQADRGTLTLDAAFAPDAEAIVFDGAVQWAGEYGVVLARINVDGSGFEIMRDLIPANPEFTNNHNYSQLNPVWLGGE